MSAAPRQLAPGTPEAAGMLPEGVERIRGHAAQWVQQGNDPAIVLLAARHGVVFLHEAFGVHRPGPEAPPLQPEAIFPLASLTKPFTATAVMQLVEEGQIGLNRPVQQYIPEFIGEGKQQVMVRHLLTHTSGVHDETVLEMMEDPPESLQIPEPPETQHPFVNRMLAFTYAAPLAFETGSKMGYSDLGVYLAGEIVRRVSGESLDAYARRRIFEPLDMSDSFYSVPQSHRPRVVRRPKEAPAGDRHLPNWLERPSPSGGMYATALDTARFAQMFLNRGSYAGRPVLSPASVAAMTRNQILGVGADLFGIVLPEASWGLGWSVAHPFKGRVYGEALPSPSYFCHGGYGGVELWVDPERELIGVYFSVALAVDEFDYSLHHTDLFMSMLTAAVDEPSAPLPIWPGSVRLRAAAAEPPTAVELRAGDPSAVGISPERLEQLRQRAQGWVADGRHPSLAMLAARRGVVFLYEALGRTGPEPDAPPLATDAVFPLASVSKPITATAVLQLVERGLIGLHRPLADYLPELSEQPMGAVNVRQLLTHTSGLRDGSLAEHARRQAGEGTAPDINHPDPVDQYFALRREAPLSTHPGTEMHYADFNYDLLGELVGRVSRSSLAEFAEQTLFAPLDMRNTSYRLTEALADGLVRRAEEAPYAAELDRWARSTLGSAGVVSSAMDLAIFGQLFLNQGSYGGQRVLSPASVAAMTRNQVPSTPAVSGEQRFLEAEWGFGWSVQITKRVARYGEQLLTPGAFSHGGAGGAMLWVDPALELVAVFLSTTARQTPSGEPEQAVDLFINALVAAIEAE